jgi:hypothetical protein
MRWLWLLPIVVARVAAADPAADFEKIYQDGLEAERMGQLDKARELLLKAHQMNPKAPGPYRYLALVAKEEKKWDECVEFLRSAIEANPSSSLGPEVRKVHDECREAAGRQPYRDALGGSAAISVYSNPSGASVKVSGLSYGGTPMSPRPITPGPHEVEVEKPGYKSAHTSVNALPDIVTDVVFELEIDPNSALNKPEKPADVPTKGWLIVPGTYAITIDQQPAQRDETGRVSLDGGTHVLEVNAPGFDRWRRRIRIGTGQKTVITPNLVGSAQREHTENIGLGLLGAGGAVLAAGFVAQLLSSHAAADAREIQRVEDARDPANPGYNLEPMHTRADFDDARSRADRWSLISDVSYGIGLATIGIGAYFLFRGDGERSDGPPPYAVVPTTGGAMVAKAVAW